MLKVNLQKHTKHNMFSAAQNQYNNVQMFSRIYCLKPIFSCTGKEQNKNTALCWKLLLLL